MSYRSGINSFTQIDLTGIQLDYILKWDGTKFIPSPDLVGGVADTHFASTDLIFTAFRTHDLGLYGMTLDTNVRTNAFYIDPSGNIGLGTNIATYPLTIDSTGAIKIPVGDTSQRPSPAVDGLIRYNNETFFAEFYGNGQWNGIGANMANSSLDITISPLHRLANNGSWTIGNSGSVGIFTVSDFFTPSVGINVSGIPLYTFQIEGTDAMKIPVGTDAQRPLIGALGLFRYNSTSNVVEYHDNTGWQTIRSDADTNFGISNITFTANRSHDLGGFDYRLNNAGNVEFLYDSPGSTFSLGGGTTNGIATFTPNGGRVDLDATLWMTSGYMRFRPSTYMIFDSGTGIHSPNNRAAIRVNEVVGNSSAVVILSDQVTSSTNINSRATSFYVNLPTTREVGTIDPVGSYFNQEIITTANDNDLIAMDVTPTYNYNSTTGHNTIGIRFSSTSHNADLVGLDIVDGIVRFQDTSALKLHSGTTAEQPTGVEGMIRHNTTGGYFEGFTGGTWQQFALGGSDTNFGITNITFTGSTVHDLAGFDLTISQTSGVVFKIDNSANRLELYGPNNETIIGFEAEASINGTAIGYQTGKDQTGTFFSAHGYQAGFQNTGINFSAGAGYRIGYGNTGVNFSGGAGYLLGFNNSGDNVSIGAGWQAGQNNTANSLSIGAGYSAGSNNTGSSVSLGAGWRALASNSGSNVSIGAGLESGYQNIGSNVSGGAGMRMLYQNSGSSIGMGGGTHALYQNSGNNVSGGGGHFAGYRNRGDNLTMAGYFAAQRNIGDDLTVFGHESGQANTGNQNTYIGAQANLYPTDTPVNVQGSDVSGGIITVADTSVFGSVGAIVPLYATRTGSSDYSPTGLYLYEILTGTTLEVVHLTASATANSEIVELAAFTEFTNATTLGYETKPSRSNEVSLGNSNVNNFRIGDIDMWERTAFTQMAVGTTAQQPTGASGMIRFDSDQGYFEGFNGATWQQFATGGGDTNMATANLTVSANRTHDLNGFTFSIGETGTYDDMLFLNAANGRIGFNTNNPGYTVDIANSTGYSLNTERGTRDSLTSANTHAYGIGHAHIYGRPSVFESSLVLGTTTAGQDEYRIANDAEVFSIRVINNGADVVTNAFTMNASGNIGVNRTPSGTKLDVNGGIGSTGSGTGSYLTQAGIAQMIGGNGIGLQTVKTTGAHTGRYSLTHGETGFEINSISSFEPTDPRISIGNVLFIYEGIHTTRPDQIRITGTSALGLHSGTTAQRPTDVIAGMVRYNSELTQFEGYNGSWVPFATGGSSTNFAIADLTATANRAHDFATFDLSITNIGALTFSATDIDIDLSSDKFLHTTGANGGGTIHENTFLGHGAGGSAVPTSVGYANTGIGKNALGNLTLTVNGSTALARSNTAVGYTSALGLVDGHFNTVIGTGSGDSMGASVTYNTMVGWHAGKSITGIENVILGANAAPASAFDSRGSVIIGVNAAQLATGTRQRNVIMGYLAMQNGTNIGDDQVAIGYLALRSESSGTSGLVAIGSESMRNANGALASTAVGYQASHLLTSGDNNTAFGYQALASNLTGNNSVAIGKGALQNNLLGTNTAVGYHAMQLSTDGVRNTVVGYLAGKSMTTASYSTFIGGSAGEFTTTGAYNTGIGRYSLRQNQTGNFNAALGNGALRESISSSNNTAVGYEALRDVTGQFSNVAVGTHAGIGLSANYTVSLGHFANRVTTGDYNIAIGYDANQDATDAALSYVVAIGTSSRPKASNQIIFGNGSTDYTTGYWDITGAVRLATGTTAQRPTGVAGYFRFNEDTDLPEFHDGTDWNSLGTGSGTVTGSGTADIIPRWNSAGTGLEDGIMSETNGNTSIAIGTASSNGRLTINTSGKSVSFTSGGGSISNWSWLSGKITQSFGSWEYQPNWYASSTTSRISHWTGDANVGAAEGNSGSVQEISGTITYDATGTADLNGIYIRHVVDANAIDNYSAIRLSNTNGYGINQDQSAVRNLFEGNTHIGSPTNYAFPANLTVGSTADAWVFGAGKVNGSAFASNQSFLVRSTGRVFMEVQDNQGNGFGIRQNIAGNETSQISIVGQMAPEASNPAHVASIAIKSEASNANNATSDIYGLYVNPDAITGDTFKAVGLLNDNGGYGIYQSGATARNYFKGSVGIDQTNPSYLLDVNGQARVSDRIFIGNGTTSLVVIQANPTSMDIGDKSSSGGDQDIHFYAKDSFWGGMVINSATRSLYIGTAIANLNTDLIAHFDGESAIQLPSGVTGSRPTGSAGMLRYNTSDSTIEFYNGASWVQPGSGGIDTNITTGNLTFSTTRTHTLGTNSVIFQGNTSNDIFEIDGTNAAVGILGSPNTNVGLTIGGTEGVLLPNSTSANRPSTPADGMIRGNSIGQTVEIYADSAWRPIEQTYEMVVTATTSTIILYKNTIVLADMSTSSRTLTLNPTDLAEGSVVKIFNTDAFSFTLDSSVGTFTYNSGGTTTSSAATRTIDAGTSHTLVWWDLGNVWYFID